MDTVAGRAQESPKHGWLAGNWAPASPGQEMDLEVVRIYAVVQTQTERSEQSGEEAGLGEESGAQRHGAAGGM